MRRSDEHRLVLIEGQEGAGKSTLIKALGKVSPYSAALDAEDIGQVDPCSYDEAFFDFLRHNIAWLVKQYWRAGYRTVITGSLLRNYADYTRFKDLLATKHETFVVNLRVAPAVRQQRRITRTKQTTQEWRDRVDEIDVVDTTFARAGDDFRYIEIENSRQRIDETIACIQAAIPEIAPST